MVKYRVCPLTISLLHMGQKWGVSETVSMSFIKNLYKLCQHYARRDTITKRLPSGKENHKGKVYNRKREK